MTPKETLRRRPYRENARLLRVAASLVDKASRSETTEGALGYLREAQAEAVEAVGSIGRHMVTLRTGTAP